MNEHERYVDALAASISARSEAGKCVRAYFEFPAEADPYSVALIGWLPLMEQFSAEARRPIVFAAPSTAAAFLAARRLHVLTPVEFLSWGDVAKLHERQPVLFLDAVIIGDLDMPEDNSVLMMMSGDGMVSQERVIRDVLTLARGGRTHMLCFHRAGWKSAFDLQELSSALTSPGHQGRHLFRGDGLLRFARASSRSGASTLPRPPVETVCARPRPHSALRIGISPLGALPLSPPDGKAVRPRPPSRSVGDVARTAAHVVAYPPDRRGEAGPQRRVG